jgi:tol-pal system protein YbgF
MTKLLTVAVLAGLAAMLGAGPLRAQDDDQSLSDRLDRLEHQLTTLQSQVYRGAAPATGGGAPSAAGAEIDAERFDEQMRALTGQIEELQHGLGELKGRVDKLSDDVDRRLQTLEHGGVPPADSTAANPNSTAQADNPPPPRNNNGGNPASSSGTLGTLPADGGKLAVATPPPANAADAGTLPSGTPQQQYDYAFGLLRDANYPAAEKALHDFVKRYPKNSLSANAQYWLGETFYVRNQYQAAAAVFAEGYQKYPKGGKAADGLFKLGASLNRLGRGKEACAIFARFDRDFRIVPAALKAKEAEEKRHAACAS